MNSQPTIPFQEFIETLLDRAVLSGLQLPITFVMMSVNGHVSAVRCHRAVNGEWNTTLLVQGKEPPNVFPVHIFFSDGGGKLMNVKIDSPGEDPKWIA